jgi:hypothetical protein
VHPGGGWMTKIFVLATALILAQGYVHEQQRGSEDASTGKLSASPKGDCSTIGHAVAVKDRPFRSYTQEQLLDSLSLALNCVTEGDANDRLNGLLIGEEAKSELARLETQPPSTSRSTGPAAISVGGINLTLGMTQKVVLSRLADGYEVKSWDRANYMIYHKGSPAPERALAMIAFTDGVLTGVSKPWSVNDQRAAQLATGLYGVLTQFKQEGKTHCTIDAGQALGLSAESNTAFISCGGKYIRMNITQLQDGSQSVIVDEVLDGK